MTNEFKDLFSELRQYLRLEKRFMLLSVAEKTTVILSIVFITTVMLMLGSVMISFLLVALANFIGDCLGSTALGYLTVALITLLLMLVFYALRTTLVINPLAYIMRNLFASTTDDVKQ